MNDNATTFRSREGGFAYMVYALIFANGDLIDGPALHAALDHPAPSLIIAADGGIRHVYAHGLRPDLVVGDMDSAPHDLLARAEHDGALIVRHPIDKDETDLELALLAAAARDCDPIRVLGALGNRLDQTLGNVSLLALPDLHGHDARLIDGRQSAWMVQPGAHAIAGELGDTLSLIPLAGAVTGICTEGLRYPLRGETLHFGPARGMSNVLIAPQATISFAEGLLLVVHTIGRI
jgi:thiamine pyrophosphokinase